MNIIQNLLTLIFLLTCLGTSLASGLNDTLIISGSADAYFRSNLNADNDPARGTTLAPATAFAGLPGFALGMINVAGAYQSGKVGAVADIVVGPRGAEAVFGSPAPLNLINQLYAYYQVTDKVKLTLGNFNTFLGYEVISPTDNFNYSTSYLFSYGPFSHTGFKANFDFGGGFTGMAGVFNPTDATDFNPTFDFVYGLRAGLERGKYSGAINLLYDDAQGYIQTDMTFTCQATARLYFALNASAAVDNFAGAAAYVQYALNDKLTAGVRGEWFNDRGVGAIGIGEKVFNFTASLNYRVGNLTIIPEIRTDILSVAGFVTEITETVPQNDERLTSLLLAAVYSF